MTRQLRMGAAVGQRRSGPPAGYCPPPTADRLSSVEEVFLVEFDSKLAGWRLESSTFAECVPQACELFLQRSTSLLGGGGSFLGRGGSLLGLAAGSHLEVKKLVGRVGIEDSVVPGTHAVPLFGFSASAERAP